MFFFIHLHQILYTEFMKKINWVLLIAIPLLWAACSKDDVAEAATETTKELTLAERTAGNNPYNVNNMQLAYDYLVQQGRLQPGMFPDFLIRPTHKYVKLKPETLEEEDQINADTTFIALDYPLDIDLPESYFEERGELQEGQIPEYYSSLKINQNIAYSGPTELIEEMYVPEEDPYFENADEDYQPGTEQITTRAQLHDELLFTAYFFKGLEHLLAPDMNAAKGTDIADDKPQKPVLTNADNTLILEGNDEKRFKDAIIKPLGIGKKWYPSGNLRYVDTSLPAGSQNQPLPGAQVLLRQGVTMRQAITDTNGNFSTSKLRGHARFVIQWERAKYNIKNKGLWQAELRGPHQRSPWDHTIQATHGEDIYHALIHTACLDYYYGSRFQLTQPRNNIRVAARQSTSPASNHVAVRGIFYQIAINEWGENHARIYGTTIHELAHSAHREVDAPSYDNLVHYGVLAIAGQYGQISDARKREARTLLETWPTTVEYLFVQRRYDLRTDEPNTTQILGGKYRQLLQNIQMGMGNGLQEHYTSCGFDMIDDYNQFAEEVNNANLPVDRVSGYTANQLERALIMTTRWNQWRDKIKQQNTNATSGNVDELFANWEF